jgi:hypothetical protein
MAAPVSATGPDRVPAFGPQETASWRQALDGFRAMAEAAPPALRLVRPAPGAWSLQEIIGHLIDSAANNHQRLVRLQISAVLDFPGYDEEEWVSAGHYQSAGWEDLTGLWWQLNLQLMHLIGRLPAHCRDRVWQRPDGAKTLEAIVRGYFDHLEIHRGYFLKRQAEAAAAGQAAGA